MKSISSIAVAMLLIISAPAKSQDEIPRDWDIDKCYYDKDSARYILLSTESIIFRI